MAQGVWTIAEQRDGEIRKITYEIVSEGRRLADVLGQELTVILLGSNIKEKAAELGQYGADRVLVADDSRLEPYTTDAYVSVISELVKANDPQILILGASVEGKDLAARLAASLDVGMAQDCTVFAIEDGNLVATRPIYAGKAYAKVTFENSLPQMAAARPKVMSISEPDASRSAEVVDASFTLDDADLKTKVVDVAKDESGKVDLTEADKIVSGGRHERPGKLQDFRRVGRSDRGQRGSFPCGSGCWLATPSRPGRADRKGGFAEPLYRLRYIRGNSAFSWHEHVKSNRRNQQG